MLVGVRWENLVAVFVNVFVDYVHRLAVKKYMQGDILFEFFCFQLSDIEVNSIARTHDVGLP